MAERGMGRGLAAILSVSAPQEAGDAGPELREVATELVKPNPNQPRRSFDESSLEALADSVREQGVLQPVLLRPRKGGTYELVAGERRWRAARLAGLERVPALVQERDDATTLEVALVENMAREDLNPVEEARAVAALVEELGLTREEVGRRVGRSRVAVSNLLRLLDLPDEALALVEDGSLTEGHGRALLLADDHADRRSIARAAVQGGWSGRVVEQRAREANAPTRAANDPDAIRVSRARPNRLHPDQEAACEEIAEAVSTALGRPVRVRPRGTGYKIEIQVQDADDAADLARRAGAPSLA